MPYLNPAAQGERRIEVEQLTKAGFSAPQIASKLRIHQRTVRRYRHLSGLSQSTPPSLTDAQVAWAEAALNDGASIAEVSRTLRGSPKTAMSRRFKGRGWSREETGRYARMSREANRLLKGC